MNLLESGGLKQKYEEEAERIIERLVAEGKSLIEAMSPSIRKQFIAALPGIAVNVAVYVTCAMLVPQFKWGTLIADNAGALTHAIFNRATAVDKSQGFFTPVFTFLKAGPISSGIRGLRNIVPVVGFELSIILPAAAQALLANQLAKTAEVTQLQSGLRKDIDRLVFLSDEITRISKTSENWLTTKLNNMEDDCRKEIKFVMGKTV
ncbi:MAG: hypothetical protein AAGG80_02970 [Pseudomonadota bacterium]